MLNGLNSSSYNSKIIGNGLQLTGTSLKGKGCDIKCDKKRTVKKQNGRGLKMLE